MSRSKKMRSIRSRWRCVFADRSTAVDAGLGGEPHLVVLDVVAGDVGDDA